MQRCVEVTGAEKERRAGLKQRVAQLTQCLLVCGICVCKRVHAKKGVVLEQNCVRVLATVACLGM